MRILLFLLAACSGTAADKAADDTSAEDTDTSTGDTDDTDAPACPTVTAGDDWAWNGECPQMRTPCDIVVNGCELEIDYAADGGMTMGMPYQATVNADGTVTFVDGDTVVNCTGTVDDADTITGSCELRGAPCTYTLRR